MRVGNNMVHKDYRDSIPLFPTNHQKVKHGRDYVYVAREFILYIRGGIKFTALFWLPKIKCRIVPKKGSPC